MTNTEISKEILRSTTDICNIHAMRITLALMYLKHLFPLTKESLPKMSFLEHGNVELLTNRFTKMHGIISDKIFTFLLIEVCEDKPDATFIDRLNKLEKLEILPSKQNWIEMRNLCRHVINEYPDKPDLMVENLNQCAEYAKQLLEYWEVLRIKVMDICA